MIVCFLEKSESKLVDENANEYKRMQMNHSFVVLLKLKQEQENVHMYGVFHFSSV